MTPFPHPEQVRRQALRTSPSAPWVTWYDVASGARIELSATTLDNWVAKAGGLLAEEFDIGPGDRVALALPLHWQLHVWVWAAWSLGAVVVPLGAHGSAAGNAAESSAQVPAAGGAQGAPVAPAVVVATARWQRPAGLAAPLLACPTDAFGLPLRQATPTGAVDAMAEVPGFPDVHPTPLPAHAAPALVVPDSETPPAGQPPARWTVLDGAATTARAAALAPPGTGPLLVAREPIGADGLLLAVLSAAVAGAGTVLVAGNPAPDQLRAIAAAEKVSTERVVHVGA